MLKSPFTDEYLMQKCICKFQKHSMKLSFNQNCVHKSLHTTISLFSFQVKGISFIMCVVLQFWCAAPGDPAGGAAGIEAAQLRHPLPHGGGGRPRNQGSQEGKAAVLVFCYHLTCASAFF